MRAVISDAADEVVRWRAHQLRHRTRAQPPSSPAAPSDALDDLTADIPDDLRNLTRCLLLWLAGLHNIPGDMTLTPGIE